MKISTHRLQQLCQRARKRMRETTQPYEEILRDLLKDCESLCTFPQQLQGFVHPIVEAAAAEFGVLAHMIKGQQRTRRAARARQAVMLAAQRAGMSVTEIGVALSRDPSTVSYGIIEAEARVASDPRYAESFAAILRRLQIDTELGTRNTEHALEAA